MPWCATCDRFYNPNSLNPDGTCRTCGKLVAEPPAPGDAPPAEATTSKAPWHFKLLVLATVLYLGWRLVQGLEWVVHHI